MRKIARAEIKHVKVQIHAVMHPVLEEASRVRDLCGLNTLEGVIEAYGGKRVCSMSFMMYCKLDVKRRLNVELKKT